MTASTRPASAQIRQTRPRGGTSAANGATEAANIAVATFIEALDTMVLNLAKERSPDIGPEVDALERALSMELPWLSGLVEAQLAHSIGVFKRSGFMGIPMRVRRMELGRIVAAIDLARSTWNGEDKLVAARASLDAANAALERAKAELDAAVQAKDPNAVLKMRPSVDITLPSACAEAEAAVMDIELERVRASLALPGHRAQASAVDWQALVDERAALVERLRELDEESIPTADMRAQRDRVAVREIEKHERSLTERRDAVRQRADADLDAAMRRLAGLPAEDRERTEDSEQELHRRQEAGRTYFRVETGAGFGAHR